MSLTAGVPTFMSMTGNDQDTGLTRRRALTATGKTVSNVTTPSALTPPSGAPGDGPTGTVPSDAPSASASS